MKKLKEMAVEILKESMNKGAAAYIKNGEMLIATNSSWYQWEYNAFTENAYLFLNKNDGSLRMVNEHISVKSGLGAGTTTSSVDTIVGTVVKPSLSAIRTKLKKFGFSRTRAGRPFPTKWRDEKTGKELALGEIVKSYKEG